MRTRIRPQEIEVPEHDPFENDLLGRSESIEVLTRLVGALEGPSVMAIDAPWGSGKSTFLRIWEQHLTNKGFPVVSFNAWETDYSRDPFVALSSELTQRLTSTVADESVREKLENVKKAGKEILRRSAPALIRIVAAYLGVTPNVGQELGQLLASYAEERLAEYVGAQESVESFREVLQDLAKTLSNLNDDRPLVILIDELDRCRPSYAIELLEIGKHFFSVDRIVFALAVNRAELAHSIKAFYGSDFDATGYLRRFIDIDFRLPDPDRRGFVDALLTATGVYAFSDPRNQSIGSSGRNRSLLQAFFSVPELSLRRIAQAIHRLGLMLTLLKKESPASFLPVTTALILRTIDPELYHRFFRGGVSDLDVAESVFSLPGLESLRRSDEGVLFEAMLIVASHEVGTGVKRWPVQSDETLSPLLMHYHGRTSSKYDGSDQEHARKLISRVEEFQGLLDEARYGQSIGFRQAADRIELFSHDLAGEDLE